MSVYVCYTSNIMRLCVKELESFFYAEGNGLPLEKIKNDEYLVCTFATLYLINMVCCKCKLIRSVNN